jgi:hypothetical protein
LVVGKLGEEVDQQFVIDNAQAAYARDLVAKAVPATAPCCWVKPPLGSTPPRKVPYNPGARLLLSLRIVFPARHQSFGASTLGTGSHRFGQSTSR